MRASTPGLCPQPSCHMRRNRCADVLRAMATETRRDQYSKRRARSPEVPGRRVAITVKERLKPTPREPPVPA